MKTIDAARLQQLFLSLAPIPSLSLQERPTADAIRALLKPSGIRVIEDGAGKKLGGNTGNLICLPPNYDPTRPAMMLTAHLDTVQSTEKLKPIVLSDRITSDGTTILGGDCRLGLSVLTYLLQEVAAARSSHKNFIVAFTVAEEIGLFGAREIELTSYPVNRAYVFDSSRRPGIYIKECVGLYIFNTHFIGKASHSGVAPEEGINAIAMASKGIANVPLGRIDSDMTVNIGMISGGQATNIVPDKVSIEGEVRSFSPQRIRERLQIIQSAFEQSANGGRIEFTSRVDFEPYVLSDNAPAVLELEHALRAAGLTPQAIRYSGGSDANMYNAKGIPTVDLGTGAQKPHTHEEFVLIEDLIKSAEIAFALIDAM
jgi:tripeptide aminopeptidase